MNTTVSQLQVEANTKSSGLALHEVSGNDGVRIEFQIEGLINRLTQIVSPDGDALSRSCAGCSGCSAA